MYEIEQILQMQFDDYAKDMTKREREMLLACSGYPPSGWNGPRPDKRQRAALAKEKM